jgi:GNAT superfamily N-acetyltransferase
VASTPNIVVLPVTDALPRGFELIRHAADGEAYGMLARLKQDWESGANRFDKPGEALVAAFDGTALVGMGGVNHDPFIPDALRMRRFYVIPSYRRRGVASAIAAALLNRADAQGRTITLSAPHAEAARFWEALGFVRDVGHDHTHIRREPYAHA